MPSIAEVVTTNDLGKLTAEQRVEYYHAYCAKLKLDPLQMPLAYIKVDDQYNGQRTIIYALRNAADQLKVIHGISIKDIVREERPGYVTYRAYAVTKEGRTDVAVGAVSIHGKTGSALANADMAADTKARRRVVLDICGVGLLDETEIRDFNSPTEVVDTPGLALAPTEKLPEPAATPAFELTPPGTPVEPTQTQVAAREALKSLPPAEPVKAEPVVSVAAPPSEKSAIADSPQMSPSADMPDPKELAAYRKRISVYTTEILPKGGLVPSAGLGINQKIQKYFKLLTGVEASKNMTKAQWESSLTFLDKYLAEKGAEALVTHIEGTLA